MRHIPYIMGIILYALGAALLAESVSFAAAAGVVLIIAGHTAIGHGNKP